MNICKSNHHFRAGLVVAMLFGMAFSAWAADVPVSLKDAFEEHFLIGAAVDRSMVTGAGSFRRSAEQNARDTALLTEQFNQISPENDLKWESIHPREGADGYDFGPADAFVNFGLSNKMTVVGHTLVWHSQTPNWVLRETIRLRPTSWPMLRTRTRRAQTAGAGDSVPASAAVLGDTTGRARLARSSWRG
jgi:GH35 family endo-1,4-beta-xylanase